MKSGTEDGNMVAQMIKEGQIVPSHVTISLLQKAMADSGENRFLIDGFPRNDENRNAFEQQVGFLPVAWHAVAHTISEAALLLATDCLPLL